MSSTTLHANYEGCLICFKGSKQGTGFKRKPDYGEKPQMGVGKKGQFERLGQAVKATKPPAQPEAASSPSHGVKTSYPGISVGNAVKNAVATLNGMSEDYVYGLIESGVWAKQVHYLASKLLLVSSALEKGKLHKDAIAKASPPTEPKPEPVSQAPVADPESIEEEVPF